MANPLYQVVELKPTSNPSDSPNYVPTVKSVPTAFAYSIDFVGHKESKAVAIIVAQDCREALRRFRATLFLHSAYLHDKNQALDITSVTPLFQCHTNQIGMCKILLDGEY